MCEELFDKKETQSLGTVTNRNKVKENIDKLVEKLRLNAC